MHGGRRDGGREGREGVKRGYPLSVGEGGKEEGKRGGGGRREMRRKGGRREGERSCGSIRTRVVY